MKSKLEIAVAALVETWRARSKLASPTDAMLINKHMRELQETVAAIQAQPDVAVGDDAKDAARYQAIREMVFKEFVTFEVMDRDEFDAAIDAAIQAQGSDAA